MAEAIPPDPPPGAQDASGPSPAASPRGLPLELLERASVVLASSLSDEGETLLATARLLVPRVADTCVAFLTDESGVLRVVGTTAADPVDEELLSSLRGVAAAKGGNSLQAAAAGAGVMVEVNPTYLAGLAASAPEWARTVSALGLRQGLSAPLSAEGRLLGALALGLGRSGRTFSPEDVSVVEEIGRRAGLALAHARRYHEARLGSQRLLRLQAVSTALFDAGSIPDVARVAVSAAREATGAAGAALFAARAEGEPLELLRAEGIDETLLAAFARRPSPTERLRAVMESGEPRVVASRQTTAEVPGGLPQTQGGADAEVFRSQTGLESWALLPLLAQGRARGILFLGFLEAMRVGPSEREFFLAVSAQCALAMDRARLTDATRRARQRAAQLQAVTEALSKAATPHEVAQVAINTAVEALRAQTGSVGLLVQGGNALSLVANGGTTREDLTRERRLIPLETSSPITDCARAGAVVALASAEEFDARYPHLESLRRSIGMQAAYAVPMEADGKRLGSLVCSFDRPEALTEDERDFLRALARQCAHAFERAQLYEEAAQARERQRLLAEASVLLSGSLDAAEVLQRLARLSVPALADWCVILLVSDTGQVMPAALRHRDPDRERQGRDVLVQLQAPTPQSVTGQALQGRAMLASRITEEMLAQATVDEDHATRLRALGLRSGIVVPLQGRARILGTLSFLRAETETPYGEQDLQLVEDLSRRAALAVENAQLYGDTERARALLDGVLDQMPVGVAIAEAPGGRIVRRNRSLERMLDLPPLQQRDSEYRNSTAFGPDGSRLRLEDWPISRAIGKGEVVSREQIDFVRRGNERGALSVNAAPVRDKSGAITGAVAVFEDVTEARHAEEERARLLESAEQARAHAEAARREAEEAVRLKDDFLATLSHEMRTPLTAILGWTRVVRLRGEVPSSLQHAMDTIERNARAQLQMVEDLLDVSRIVAGKMRLRFREVDLLAVVRAALETVEPAATAKMVELRLRVDEGAFAVPGDPDRLQQICWNLLSNAIKFTPPGGQVEARVFATAEQAHLSVRDTGRGISKDFLPQLFARFRQADGGLSRAEGGLGLGLAICRHLAESHGGTIAAHSDGEGMGATFTVSLPRGRHQIQDPAAPESMPPPPSPAPVLPQPPLPISLAGVRVLLVEDDTDARELLGMMLEQYGAEVTLAPSAAAGLAVLASRPVDVLVSDISMPGEDGYAFVSRVRGQNAAFRDVPAAALTANARREDQERALAAGFQLHVVKPVEPEDLARAVQELARRKRGG